MKELIQGNEAAVRGAINAGCNFFAGYPITPSSEIAHGMAEQLPKFGGVFVQMEDEIASISAAIGAAMVGAKAMTATSGPGFSLMQESIGYASLGEIPVVIFNVMRAGPSTGIPTAPSQGDVMQARYGSHGDYVVIVLAPADVRDMYFLTFDAFMLAEKYSIPVIVLSDEIIGHMREGVELPPTGQGLNNSKTDKPGIGQGLRIHKTGLVYDEDGMPTTDPEKYELLVRRLFDKIESNKEDILRYKAEYCQDAEILFLTYGSPYRSARSAVKKLRKDGIKAGLFKAETLFPFPEEALKQMAETVDRIIVPEMNMGQIFREVQRVAGGICDVELVSSVRGTPISPEILIRAVKG